MLLVDLYEIIGCIKLIDPALKYLVHFLLVLALVLVIVHEGLHELTVGFEAVRWIHLRSMGRMN